MMKIEQNMLDDMNLIIKKSNGMVQPCNTRKLLKEKYNINDLIVKCIYRIFNICAQCGCEIDEHINDDIKKWILSQDNINNFFIKQTRKRNVRFCCDKCYSIKQRICSDVLHKPDIFIKSKLSLNKYKNTDAAKKMYKTTGKNNSKKLKLFFSTQEGRDQIERVAEVQSMLMREKIKNGEFVPAITNSFTHWDAKIIIGNKIIKFRSSWEACFWKCNQNLEYETQKIPWVDTNGKNRTYIADFFDREKNIIYELKPKVFYHKQKEKMDCIIQYCIDNNIKFIWINESNIETYIDPLKFKGTENEEQYDILIKYINIRRTNERHKNVRKN